MKPRSLLGLALLLGTAVWAQPPTQPSSPASITDPAAPVPPSRYRSVFADTPTGVETGTEDWKKANADVGQFRNGFVDILKWEAAQEANQFPSRPDSGRVPQGHQHNH